MLDPRARRIADNEARFRDINDRLEADLRRLPVDEDPVEFVCECGNRECCVSVRLTLDEYAAVREDAMQFTMVPGHAIPGVEDVVLRAERYLVVRKHREAAPVVGG